MREIRSLIPNADAQSPDSVQHHTARAGCRAEPADPDVRRGPTARGPRQQDRLPQDVRGTRGAVSGRAPRTFTRSTTSSRACRACVRGGRRCSQAIVKLNEGVSGAGNAMVDLSELPDPGSPDEAAAIRDRLMSMQPESEKLDCRRLSGRLREERRHRRGADHRRSADQSECPDAGVARRHRRTAVHPRPASRWRERSEVPRLRVPRQSRLRRGHRRARHGDRKSASQSSARSAGSRWISLWCRTTPAHGRPTRSS